jgi:DNA-binding IclR family transcriptional regulator
MTEKPDSSLARMLAVLDLFTEQALHWTAEAITEEFDLSIATGYRYVRMLTDAGLLQRSADSTYTLGPRIMVLDHFMRRGDPVLAHAIPFMKELVALTGFDCVLSSLYGEKILDTHQELSPIPANLSYGRGRPRPLFRGAAPKVILAHYSSVQLRKVFDADHSEISASGLPVQWDEFRKYYANIRKRGHYTSTGEVDQNVAAIAVPMQYGSSKLSGAITLISSLERMSLIDQTKLIQMLQRAARDIESRTPI